MTRPRIETRMDILRGAAFELEQALGNKLQDEIPVFIGNPDGGTIYVDENTRTEIYVHDDGATVSGASFISASGIPKDKVRFRQPILIKQSPNGSYRYVGIDDQSDTLYSAGNTETVTADPVYVEQIRYGTIHPYSGLSVLVVGAMYDGTYWVNDLIADAFDGTAEDTSMVSITPPTTNNRQIAVLIQLDATTSTLEFKQSSEYSSAINRSNAYSASLLPTRDADRFLVGYVFLKAGMTSITYSDIWQLPEFLNAGGGGGGASLPVDDTTSLVQDPADNTKQMRVDVGNVSASTVRTLTMPDADVILHKNNLSASDAPTVNDDIDLGYTVGSIWIDTTDNDIYQCTNNSDGAAVWQAIGGRATIIGQTYDGSPEGNADYVAFYDTDEGVINACLIDDLPIQAGYSNSATQHIGTGEISNPSTSSTSYVEASTSYRVTLTTSGGDVVVIMYCTIIQSSGAGGTARLVLDNGGIVTPDADDDTSAAEYFFDGYNPTGNIPSTFVARFSSLSADTYTVKMQWKTSSGSVVLNNTLRAVSLMAMEV